MLGLAVAVGVVPVRRPDCDSHREERQQRRDEVCAGVECLGEQPETPGRESGHELQDEERRRGENGDESSSALWRHTRKA